MKNMRQLINLMEGVSAVPGLGSENLNEYIRTDSPLRDMNDYRARMKELQAIQMDPNTARDPQLKAELTRKKVMIDQQAREMGLISENEEGAAQLGVGAKVYPRWDQKGEPFKIVGMTQSGKWVCVDDYGNKGMMAGEDLVPAAMDEAKSDKYFAPIDPTAELDGTSTEELRAIVIGDIQDFISDTQNNGYVPTDHIMYDSSSADAFEEIRACDDENLKRAYGAVRSVAEEQSPEKFIRVAQAALKILNAGVAEDIEKPAQVVSCQQSNPAAARDACAMEEDLNNGYDEVHYAAGNDYFPNGADSPVVKKVGPSGARQGDNPEQKKMQVAETHKELVYAYRSYLKESATSKKFDPTNDPYVNKWGHLGVAGNTIDSDDIDAYRAEEERIKKLKAADAAKLKKKK